MDQQPSRIPPAEREPGVTSSPDRAHWTPSKQRVFIAMLIETGSIAHAARAVGMSRSSAHRLRARLVGTPFDSSWTTALRLHAERLADPFGDCAGAAPRPAFDRAPAASEPRQC